MHVFKLRDEQEFDPSRHVEKVLGEIGGGDRAKSAFVGRRCVSFVRQGDHGVRGCMQTREGDTGEASSALRATVEAKPHRTREGDATPDRRSGVVTIFSRGRCHRNSHAV